MTDLIAAALARACKAVGVADPAGGRVHVERTARSEHGRFYSNVAMAAAKQAGRPPRELAGEIARALAEDPPLHLERVEVAGPGFLNFHLTDGWLADVVERVVLLGEAGYGAPDLGRGESVQIEFVSANPTGPLHVGNGWLCSFGDTLARLMRRCGYSVSTEYYVNDTGGQVRLLGASVLAVREASDPPEGGYRGAYIAELAERLPAEHAADPVAAGRWAAAEILEGIRRSLERLGVRYDCWFSQASIEEGGAVEETIAELRAKGLVFEADGAVWLRTSVLGDSRDRVLVKSSGDVTYLGGDIAYHRNKFLVRGFDRVIDVFGADHHGQVASLKAAIRALGVDPSRLEILLGQMVSLSDGKMSKRAGNFVTLDELLDDIGEDAFRLLSLMKSINESTVLDLDLVRRQSMENPVFYVQYAHARIASIGRVAAERNIVRVPVGEADLSLLVHPREAALIECLDLLPEVVAEACERREPFKVTGWLRTLAGCFHGFYHDCYVMGEGVPHDLTQARLQLVEASRICFAIGLDLIGVHAPESM